MGKKIDQLLAKPVYPYLYGFAFLIFKSSVYFGSFDLLRAINFLFLFCVATCLLIFFFGKIIRPALAGIPTVIIWVSLFHVVGVSQLFHYPYAYIPIAFYAWFYCFVLLVLSVFCFVSGKLSFLASELFNRLANVFLLICSIVFFLSGVHDLGKIKMEVRKHDHGPANKLDLNLKKDIVWILMDEYGSSGSLNEQFSFKNPLDSLLQEKQFSVLTDMHTRYNSTLFSVNSIFNLDDSIKPSSYYEGVDLLRNSAWVPLLEKSGYRFVNLSFFEIAKHPMLTDRSGYPYTYLQQLFSGTVFSMLYIHWRNSIKKCDNYSIRVLQSLRDTLLQSSPQPRFIWAHMPIPHEPFCRDSFGQIKKDTIFGAMDSVPMKRGYIEYLQYGNSILLSLLKQYPGMLNKIIIITGDHGPRFPFLPKKEFQQWPFAAIHIPGQYDSAGLKKLGYISQLPGFLLHHLSGSAQK